MASSRKSLSIRALRATRASGSPRDTDRLCRPKWKVDLSSGKHRCLRPSGTVDRSCRTTARHPACPQRFPAPDASSTERGRLFPSMPSGIQRLRRLVGAAVLALAGCASAPPDDAALCSLTQMLESRPIVLLGEVHDNTVQHALRARALRALVASGARPALLMEQFDRERQADLDRAMAQPGATADEVIAAATPADASMQGWSWPLYRPYIALALEYRLPLVAANVSRVDARRIAADGLAAHGFEATCRTTLLPGRRAPSSKATAASSTPRRQEAWSPPRWRATSSWPAPSRRMPRAVPCCWRATATDAPISASRAGSRLPRVRGACRSACSKPTVCPMRRRLTTRWS